MWRGLGLLVCAACGKGDDSDVSACGDVDGAGTDTGDIPNLRGDWTSSFGLNSFEETCAVSGMQQHDMFWINGAALEIKGQAPDRLLAVYDDEEFWGVMNEGGGLAFSGIHDHNGYDMNVTFGGLAYHNDVLGQDRIEGFVYMGVDASGDGHLDCHLSGDYVAIKSGG
jgi:hypothetical protein